MKKIVLFLLFFVNLQIIYNGNFSIRIFSCMYSQTMNSEGGYDCYDEFGWYNSPFSDCGSPECTQDTINCRFDCGSAFISAEEEAFHALTCLFGQQNETLEGEGDNEENSNNESYSNPNSPTDYGTLGNSSSGTNSGTNIYNPNIINKCSVCNSNPCICCSKCKQAKCICCSKCGFYPCICCPECKRWPCICCPVCYNNPCICCQECKKVKDQCICCKKCKKAKCECKYKINSDTYKMKTDSVHAEVSKDNPKTAACNIGVQKAFQSFFGNIPPELNRLAAQIADTLSKGICQWKKIEIEEVNIKANEEYFVIFASKRQHVCTILPGHHGTNLTDIYRMDTGYYEENGVDVTRSNERKLTNGIGQKTLDRGAFYYYDPSDCP